MQMQCECLLSEVSIAASRMDERPRTPMENDIMSLHNGEMEISVLGCRIHMNHYLSDM